MGKPIARKVIPRPSAGWRYSNNTLHAAFDYSVPIGTPVFAVRAGRILKVVDHIPNLAPDEDGPSGAPANFIPEAIKFKGDRATVAYAHLSPHALVAEGDEVEEGQQIALSGHNGHTTGAHLHVSAVLGHADHNFPELDHLAQSALRPTTGIADNGTTIFPPNRVYGRKKFNELDSGDIVLEDLNFGTRGSDTVRRLQYRLNGIRLVHGAELTINGHYNARTRDEVVKWQVQKRHAVPGNTDASGNVSERQAEILFSASRFRLVHRA
jgi:hypothetical protein